MQQVEREATLEEVIRSAIAAAAADVHTCMVVSIVSFDPTTMTATVQPTLRGKVQLQDGVITTPATPGLPAGWQDQTLPVLVNCPVLFIGGGGFTITTPIAAGDEALAFFSERAIDTWWLRGGIQNRVDMRCHSLYDGFILVGPRSQPNVLSDISTTALEIRSDDNTTNLSIQPAGVAKLTGTLTVDGLKTTQTATPSATSSDHSIPITVKLAGVPTVMYIRLSATP